MMENPLFVDPKEPFNSQEIAISSPTSNPRSSIVNRIPDEEFCAPFETKVL